MQRTELLPPDDAGIARAAALLAAGELVAFPTETVYGLGADARSDTAVVRVFEAKGRPRFNPLIVHVADIETARRIAAFDDEAERLASAFWPGPLTLVLPLLDSAGISPLVTAGLESIALRIPSHPLARRLLKVFGGPVAAPSANPSGRVSPTRPAHVLDGLDGRIAAVLDGGPCDVGVESTIVGLVGGPALLRLGGLPAEAIEACLGHRLVTAESNDQPTSPGQLASHYAPNASIRLNAAETRGDEVMLAFGLGFEEAELNLSPAGDLPEAAANLFHYLRRLDELNRPIAVSPIPETGLGRAINDRLRRAAAPRTEVRG